MSTVTSRTTTPTAPLPAPGPPWYGVVMGTGILATLLQTYAGLGSLPVVAQDAARVVLVLAWGLLLGLSGAFLVRAQRDRGVLGATLRDNAVLPTWGSVSMGLLAVGAATSTVLPVWVPAWDRVALGLDALLWVLGTALGLVTAVGFTLVLLRRGSGAPVPAWGLPLVPPMVSATTGVVLATHLTGSVRGAMDVVLLGCFLLALGLGGVVFATAYHHHWRHRSLPLAAAPSTWIPLGIVGQSTAAAQGLAHLGVVPAPLADAYGAVVLLVGVPMATYAVVATARGFLRRMPFSPGWWSLTFPIGTLSLGTHAWGVAVGSTALADLGVALCLVLVGTWALCAVASVRAVARA